MLSIRQNVMSELSHSKSCLEYCEEQEQKTNQASQDSDWSAEERALEIHLIISQILHNLDYNDLKNCRLVRKSWNAESCKVKLRRFVIRFRYCQACREPSTFHCKHQMILEERKNFNDSSDPISSSDLITTTIGTTCYLTMSELKSKLCHIKSKQLWLDAQDGHVTVDVLEEFFSIFENSISHLSFTYQPTPKESIAKLNKFLDRRLPKLEYFEFADGKNNLVSRTSSADCGDLGNLSNQFPNPLIWPLAPFGDLKIVRLSCGAGCHGYCCTKLVQNIVQSAPNLDKIYGIPFTSVVELKEENAKKIIGALKSLNPRRLSLYHQRGQKKMRSLLDISNLQNLALEEFQLVYYSLPIDDKQRHHYQRAYGRILESSQHTLKKLELEPLEYFGFIRLPQLEKLETLSFLYNFDAYNTFKILEGVSGRNYFPKKDKDFNFSHTFPNLRVIELNLQFPQFPWGAEENPMAFFEKMFPTEIFRAGQHPNFARVETLKIKSHNIPGVCLERLAVLFPGVRTLGFELDSNSLKKMLPICFTLWPHMEKIIIEMSVNILEFIDFDRILTGIEDSELETLKNFENDQLVPVQQGDRRRVRPSICDLKDLQLLKFVFKDDPWVSTIRNPPGWFSHVSGTHALAIMTKLRVGVDLCNLRCEQKQYVRELFQPILSWVTINYF